MKKRGNKKLTERVKESFRKGRDTLEYYGGAITVKTAAKAGLVTLLGMGVVGGTVYLTTPDHLILPSIPQPVVQKKKNPGIEALMKTTEQIVVKATYEKQIYVGDSREVTLKFSGSGICVHKSAEENLAFYLTCAHVVDVPKSVYIFGSGAQLPNGDYKVDLRDESGKPILSSVTSSTNPSALAGNAVLKKTEIGIYDGELFGEMKLIPLEVLADSDFSSEPDWNDDEDLALLKVQEAHMKSFPERFTVFEGNFADEYAIRPGDKLWAIGFPAGLGKQVCSGEVRRKDPDQTYTLMSVPINPGNSGGPIFVEREVEELLDNGTVRKTKVYEFAGLGRLGYPSLEDMTGMNKMSLIKSFLRGEGYSYIYK